MSAAILFGLAFGAFFKLAHDLPQINRLKQYTPPAATAVVAADGRIIARLFQQKRYPVNLDTIPDRLVQAVIATEDRDFYSHAGIHPKGILRAIVENIRSGRFKQGASTLTQQLAKTLFLTTEKSITRKIKEAILSIQIERRYTKDEILTLYLNQIYLGSGAYGVEAAARTYFGTSVSELTLGQAAMIAGLPKAPARYTPLSHPERARERRQVILALMREQGHISTAQYQTALAEPVLSQRREEPPPTAPYFMDHLKRELRAILDMEQVYSRGLSIHTTLDIDLQHQAEAALSRHIAALKSRMTRHHLNADSLEGAVVALDTQSGAIRCMIGGTDYEKSRFNRAVQARRQPGSAFKPFVFAAAILEGASQTDTVANTPLTVPLDNGRTWEVENFSRTYTPRMTLRNALARSKNVTAVRLMARTGPGPVIHLARKAGITSRLMPFPSLALGSFETTLLELTHAYIPFAAKGIQAVSHAVTTIEDSDGRVLYAHTIKQYPVMPRPDAAIMADMLKAVIHEGTGRTAARIKKEIGGKTGTTDHCRDGLFIGFCPGLSLGVWVGNDGGGTLGPNETGARTALPIWTDTMDSFLAHRPVQYFDIPQGTRMVHIDPDTGDIVPAGDPKAVRVLVKAP